MNLADIIDTFISGDWGEESPTEDTPNAAYCVRGADQGRRITLWHQFSKERTVPSRSLSFCFHAALSFILFYPC